MNSAGVVDPVTGNPAMSLPIDVVESAIVITKVNLASILRARILNARSRPSSLIEPQAEAGSGGEGRELERAWRRTTRLAFCHAAIYCF
jgi:hypothetical protein